MARQNWDRLTVNVDPLLAAAIKLRAKQQRRSVSGYLQTLIESDLKATGVAEEPGPYGESAEAADKKAAAEQAKRAAKPGSERGPRR